ncbi:MAG: hypothetical protein VX265_01275 [Myxococcota bacterium]|nr:hypothetical protein [Myxococcota bacterium]
MRIALLLAAACVPEPDPATIRVPVEPARMDTAMPGDTAAPLDDPAADLVPLEGPRLLRRVSLDLRGTLPTPAELDSAAADPGVWRNYAAQWVTEPAFEERLVALLAEHWWTRIDTFEVVRFDYDLTYEQEFEFDVSVGEEPLRLIARVVAEDRPWSDVVTAPHTLANPMLADLWPIDYPEGAEGWQEATYTDGRPHAGVLSTNGLWWRYTTTDSNMNRSRAAAISRLLLCQDYLARPITLTGAEDVSDPELAIRTDPYCVACHASLDPVAASMFGFWWLSLYSRIEQDVYHPEREALAEEFLGVEPAWYGAPTSGLADLGYEISRDNRLYACAVETFAKLYWRRAPDRADDRRMESLRVQFLEAGASPQALILALLETHEYQAGGVMDGAHEDAASRARTVRMVSPDQLSRTVEALTGLVWTRQGHEVLQNDETGFRMLAGGVDGWAVTEPQTAPSLPWSLVMKRHAQAAADRAVREELERQQQQTPDVFFGGLALSDRPGDAPYRKALGDIWWRLTATPLGDEDRNTYAQLWLDVDAEDGPAMAWRAVLSTMMRDPLFLTY